MCQPSSIATKCAESSHTIDQVVASVARFTRQARESRHHMNAITSELLAIKTILDILYDDDTSSAVTLPDHFFDPLAGMLDRCAKALAQMQRRVDRMASDIDMGFKWEAFWRRECEKLVARLECLKGTLDLTLDHVSLYTTQAARTDASSGLSPSEAPEDLPKNKFDTGAVLSLLKRNDTERKRMEELNNEDDDSMLDSILSMLKSCAESAYEESITEEETTKRSDSLSVADEPIPVVKELIPSPRKPDPTSTLIGAWLENITAQSVQDPVEGSGSIFSYRAPSSPKHLTRHISFFSVSSSAPSIATGPKSVKSFLTGSANSLNKMRQHASLKTGPKSKGKSGPRKPSPIPEAKYGEEDSMRGQSPQPREMRNALASRSRLTKDQQIALDEALAEISNTPAPHYVEQLLAEGADANIADRHFGTLLMRAAYCMSAEVIDLLARYGADLTRTGVFPYHSVLHAAVAGQRLENVQCLIELGASLDAVNDMGETPLHMAVSDPGTFAVVKELLEWGADVNAMTDHGISPLQYALGATTLDSRNRKDMVELLLAHGADFSVHWQRSQRDKGLAVLGLI